MPARSRGCSATTWPPARTSPAASSFAGCPAALPPRRTPPCRLPWSPESSTTGRADPAAPGAGRARDHGRPPLLRGGRSHVGRARARSAGNLDDALTLLRRSLAPLAATDLRWLSVALARRRAPPTWPPVVSTPPPAAGGGLRFAESTACAHRGQRRRLTAGSVRRPAAAAGARGHRRAGVRPPSTRCCASRARPERRRGPTPRRSWPIPTDGNTMDRRASTHHDRTQPLQPPARPSRSDDVAPDFELPSPTGETVKLSDLRGTLGGRLLSPRPTTRPGAPTRPARSATASRTSPTPAPWSSASAATRSSRT